MATSTPPKALGKTSSQPTQGPTKEAATGLYAERNPAPGALTIENNGGDGFGEGDWAVLDSNGVKLNPPICTPQSLAYWIKRHDGYAARIENLDALGVVQPHSSTYAAGGRGYRIADVATGKWSPMR